MKYEIHPRLFVGDEIECPADPRELEHPNTEAHVLHACKHPCFVRANLGKPAHRDDPSYLGIEIAPDLYLNLIDPPTPLFQLRSFRWAMEWIDRSMRERGESWPPGAPANVLIHCNSGVSRSPSIALLWLARHRFIVPDTYKKARQSFDRLAIEATRGALYGVTPYAPGLGIATFLETHWKELVT